MSDQAPQTPPEAAAPSQGPLVINAQYVKDLSFEVPGAPQKSTRPSAPRRRSPST